MRFIADAAAAVGTFGTASFQRLGQQATSLGKRLMSTGRYLANRHAASYPGDHVPAIGDINLGFILVAFNTPALVNRVQLGMQ